MPKTKSDQSGKSSLLTRLSDGAYRFFYTVGAQAARRFARLRRAVRRQCAPAHRRIAKLWRTAVLLPLHRMARRHHLLRRRLKAGGQELRQAAGNGIFAVFSCFGRLVRRAVHCYRGELRTALGIAAPLTAAAVLAVTVSVWTNMEFCLSLTYAGQQLGYIDDEITYEQAAVMAKERVVDINDAFSVEAVPTLAVTMQGSTPVLDNAGLCDAILRTAGDSIVEATGLYVDGDFLGAMESNSALTALLDGIKSAYYDASDKNQRAEFIQSVTTLDGLFPAETIVTADQLKAKLTSEAVVEKTYTVQAGDSISRIASKNDMTMAQLREMNPKYADTDMVHIGDVFVVQRPQPFLRVKVIKTIYYSEKIDYNTQYKQNTDKPVTYSKVLTKGVEGSRDVVAEVTYLDGSETGREVVQTTVTKEPVTRVIERGTKKVISSGGTAVVQGDGKTTGTMIWPVPICHNMSRGYKSGHYALDIANGPVTVNGKPALAADGGTVIKAATGWNGGYGNVVMIQHSNGLVTLYAHLRSIQVVAGQYVSQGQQIGLIGSTGNSSGPHLHFEVRKNGVRVDPLKYVTP